MSVLGTDGVKLGKGHRQLQGYFDAVSFSSKIHNMRVLRLSPTRRPALRLLGWSIRGYVLQRMFLIILCY